MAEGTFQPKSGERGDAVGLHTPPGSTPVKPVKSFIDIAIELGYCAPAQVAELRADPSVQGLANDEVAALLVEKKILTQEQVRACERAQLGRSVGGFEILEKVGQGGMGTVFRARQVSMDRIVAVKILAPKLAQDPQFKQRFLNEARVSAKLSHLNIINGIDCGEDSGYTFFAMEYVEGRTLKAILKEKGKLPPEMAFSAVRQIADALVYARRQGLVHRDIKPDNIMLTPYNAAKLCDLGLATHAEKLEDFGKGQQRMAVGTPHYMSPEQACGEENLDGRSDIYSLGATFYQLLTGNTLFNARTSAEVMSLHLSHDAKNPCDIDPAIPEGYGLILTKMLAKSAADRYLTAEELVEDMEAVKNNKLPKAAAFKAPSSCAQMTTRPRAKLATGGQVKTRDPVAPVLAGLVVLAGVAFAAYKFGNAGGGAGDGPQASAKVSPRTAHAVTDPAAAKVSVEEMGPQAPPPEIQKHGNEEPKVTPPTETVPVNPQLLAKNTEPAPPKHVKAPPPAPAKPPQVPRPPPIPLEIPRPKLELTADILYTRFLNEMNTRAGKMDLTKLLAELRDISLKSEYRPAREEINKELADLKEAQRFEQAALQHLAESKGKVDLSEEMAKKWDATSGKVVGYDESRGLQVDIKGASFYVSAMQLPVARLLAEAGDTSPVAQARYQAARGSMDGAFALIPSMPPEESKRWERKLFLQVAGEKELIAREAYKNLAVVAAALAWKTFNEMADEFEKGFRGTPTAHDRAPQIEKWRSTARRTLEARPPWEFVFHAQSVSETPDGFLEVAYDFKTPDQNQDFACDKGTPRVSEGRLLAPKMETEYGIMRFNAPIDSLREFKAVGRTAHKELHPMGVLFLTFDGSASQASPALKLDPATHAASAENMEGGKSTGSVTGLNWLQDVEFSAESPQGKGDLNWSVNGESVGSGKLPPSVEGGWLALWGAKGNTSWASFKIVFKPDPIWEKSALKKAKAAASAMPDNMANTPAGMKDAKARE